MKFYQKKLKIRVFLWKIVVFYGLKYNKKTNRENDSF